MFYTHKNYDLPYDKSIPEQKVREVLNELYEYYVRIVSVRSYDLRKNSIDEDYLDIRSFGDFIFMILHYASLAVDIKSEDNSKINHEIWNIVSLRQALREYRENHHNIERRCEYFINNYPNFYKASCHKASQLNMKTQPTINLDMSYRVTICECFKLKLDEYSGEKTFETIMYQEFGCYAESMYKANEKEPIHPVFLSKT